MKLKRAISLIMLVIIAMALISCGKKKEAAITPTPTPVEEVATPTPIVTAAPTPTIAEVPEGMVKSYLTGEYVPEEIGRRRPIAVMINNAKVAVPQAGIANAGVVYEAAVEGGITRLMTITEDYDNLEKIGSMRSCRNYYIFYAAGFDAIYVHYGQAVYALDVLDLPQVNNLSGLAGYGESVFYRTSDRKAPHNAYTSYEGIQRGIEICGYSQEYQEDYQGSYVFATDDNPVELPGEWEAKTVEPGYSINDARFEYNEEDGLYYRFQYGDKQIDELTNEQLAYKNVLIQYSTWRNYDENGYLDIDVDKGNKGVYITNGKAIEVNWDKKTPWGATNYYDNDGNQIVMNQGKTWVCIIQDTYKDRVIIGSGNPLPSEPYQSGDNTPASSESVPAADGPNVIAPEPINDDGIEYVG